MADGRSEAYGGGDALLADCSLYNVVDDLYGVFYKSMKIPWDEEEALEIRIKSLQSKWKTATKQRDGWAKKADDLLNEADMFATVLLEVRDKRQISSDTAVSQTS